VFSIRLSKRVQTEQQGGEKKGGFTDKVSASQKQA
jgi:hypothetical protein